MKREFKIEIFEYQSTTELTTEDANLVQKAKEAALKAYSPYSNFGVGAAILLENDQIILGNNQENAAYPSGLCAERVGVFYANATYPNIPVKSVAVTAFNRNLNSFVSEPVPPCGSCRQVMIETQHRFGKPIRLIMAGEDKIIVVENMEYMLPLQFDGTFLI
jgi:cytidine deaminase